MVVRISDIGISGKPCFIIAEAGVNHNGRLDIALNMIDTAVQCGVDAVKFQTFTPELLVSPLAEKAEYQKETTGQGGSQLDMLRRLMLPESAWPILKHKCDMEGVVFLSTPFSEYDADLLETVNIEAYKVPSGEITNLPYLKHIAKKGKPIILSTGMSNEVEVLEGVNCIMRSGGKIAAILQCTSNYPAKTEDANLRAMTRMGKELLLPYGYSDHTPTNLSALLAVAMGASVIEKHFTLDRNAEGPDHATSVDEKGLLVLVQEIRLVESIMGTGIKEPVASEMGVAAVARKSIHAVRNIPMGNIIKQKDLICLRPGTGISPSQMTSVVGCYTTVGVLAGTMLTEEMLIR